MISRLTTIRGVGKFVDYRADNGLSFGANTIIFGQNAMGKSTLTDIFWSLKAGQASFIEGRRTFGFMGDQKVEINDDAGQVVEFPGDRWAAGNDGIEIFDTRFINENIFEGGEITYDHQRNLHSVMIGQKGSELAREIAALQDEMAELTARKRTMTAEFNNEFNKDISLADFRRLSANNNAEKEIAELQAMIDNARNQENVKKVFDTLDSYLLNIIQQDTRQVLSQTLETTAEKVQAHINKTWEDPRHSRDFLQTGLSLTRSENNDCVFCGQPHSVQSKELLAAYGRLFSAEYKTLQSAISNAIGKFAKWNPVTFADSLVDKLATIKIGLKTISLDTVEGLRKLKANSDAEFESKAKDIGHVVSFDDYDRLLNYFAAVKKEVTDLRNKYVLTEAIDIGHLNQKKREIELSEERHSPHWIGFLKEYDRLDDEQDSLKNIREKKREQLNAYSEQLFSLHLDTINKVLKLLHADFTIIDFQPMKKLVGKTERIFALEFFDQHRVNLSQDDKNFPTFDTSLSDSDKRVLAFAFFYSLMMHDPELDKKVIIFDDPFSSFDRDRRAKTAELLTNPYLLTDQGEVIERSIGQLIILTHEIAFFKWLNQRLPSATTLRIIPDGEINGVKKSALINFSIDELQD